jgi:hypothetical protein
MATLFQNKKKSAPLVVNPKKRNKNKKLEFVELSPYIDAFLRDFEKSQLTQPDESEQRIKVSEVVGRLARIYEKARTTIEYKASRFFVAMPLKEF